MPDGTVPVMEATITLHSIEHPDWANMTIGIPLGLCSRSRKGADVVLNFSGARWTM